eukprot:jgi/Galph1/3941/GphlegSOOS_G2600.1
MDQNERDLEGNDGNERNLCLTTNGNSLSTRLNGLKLSSADSKHNEDWRPVLELSASDDTANDSQHNTNAFGRSGGEQETTHYNGSSVHSEGNQMDKVLVSISQNLSESSKSVFSVLNQKLNPETKSNLANFISCESMKYYDLSKSHRHIRQENAYVHAFLRTRVDCPNTTVILPQTIGSDRVFRFKSRNVATLFDIKSNVNKDTSSGGTTSNGGGQTQSGGPSSGSGRKKAPTGRMITQRILEEEANNKEQAHKEFEEKVQEVLMRKGKFSLDEETAKELMKEYTLKKVVSVSKQSQPALTAKQETDSKETQKENEENLQLADIPKNKKESTPEEQTPLELLRERLKALEKQPKFTNLVDFSKIIQVFPEDHWSSEQVKRLSLFLQQTHGLSATIRLERLTQFIQKLNEEVRVAQKETVEEPKRKRAQNAVVTNSKKKKSK